MSADNSDVHYMIKVMVVSQASDANEETWLYESDLDQDDLTPFKSKAARFEHMEDARSHAANWTHAACQCALRHYDCSDGETMIRLIRLAACLPLIADIIRCALTDREPDWAERCAPLAFRDEDWQGMSGRWWPSSTTVGDA